MTKEADTSHQVIARWMALAPELRRAVRGLSAERLDARAGPEGLSARETGHHLVEANLVASNIVIAALARSGCAYDWSWLTPDRSWTRRLGYDKAPIGPALSTMSALTRQIGALLSVGSGRLDRTVRLRGSSGAPPQRKTIGQLLSDEVAHAREHLDRLGRRPARAARPRGRRKKT
jgi:hypothetical protein